MRLISSIAAVLALILAGLSSHRGLPQPASFRKAGERSFPALSSTTIPRTTVAEKLDVASAVHAYEREPTEDFAAAVWEAFDELDGKIAQCRQRVDKSAGGVRAEAELARIELQRLRDEQMPRFLNARNRWKAACAAFDALAAAGDSTSGVQNAAAILAHRYRQDVEMQTGGTLRP